MKIKLILLFTTCGFIFYVFPQDLTAVQNLYSQIYQAELLAKSGDKDSALVVFEKSIQTLDFIPTNILYKAINISKNVSHMQVRYYKNILKSRKNCPTENKQLLTKVDSLLILDQKYMSYKPYKMAYSYILLCNLKDTCNITSSAYIEAVKLNNERIEKIRKNVNSLIQLIDNYGYIHDGLIGTKNWYNFQVQLFHFDTDTNNVILEPILRKALSQNLISPLTYSVTMDRHLYATSGRQKYWTSPFDTNNPYLSKKEVEDVLRLRESIGIFGSKFEFKQLNNGNWQVINSY